MCSSIDWFCMVWLPIWNDCFHSKDNQESTDMGPAVNSVRPTDLQRGRKHPLSTSKIILSIKNQIHKNITCSSNFNPGRPKLEFWWCVHAQFYFPKRQSKNMQMIPRILSRNRRTKTCYCWYELQCMQGTIWILQQI